MPWSCSALRVITIALQKIIHHHNYFVRLQAIILQVHLVPRALVVIAVIPLAEYILIPCNNSLLVIYIA